MNHAAVFTTYKSLIASEQINQFTSRSKSILHRVASESVLYIWYLARSCRYTAPDTAPFFSVINQPLVNQDTEGDHEEAEEWGKEARYNISNYELWIRNQENEREDYNDRVTAMWESARLAFDDEREE